MLGEILHQRRPIGVAAVGIAQRVQLQHRLGLNAQRAENIPPARNRLGIGQWLGGADQLAADLVELAITALLRPLVTEHRAGVEDFLRQGLRQPVGDKRTTHARRAFRSQRQAIPTAIGEGVHLLRHHIGRIAERAGENAGVFENRGGPFFETVAGGDLARGVDDMGEAAEILADQVARAANRL